MFPISWNKAYRKKDGSLTIIDDMFVDGPELQEEIDAIDGRLDTAESDITALDGRLDTAESSISTAQSDITSLDGRLDTAESSISTAQSDITSLTTKTTFLQRTIYSEGVAIAANSYATDTIDIAYEGYTPIYFAPVGTNHDDAWITSSSISSATVTIYVRSISAQTVKGAINVLYQKIV